MKIAIASDHRGFRLKSEIISSMKNSKFIDFGTYTEESCDYPDYALKVSEAISSGEFERGILICSTGVGMSIAANKIRGIRAALCLNEDMARQSREHVDSNILVLGADLLSAEKAEAIISEWLSASFSNEEKHARRIEKIRKTELPK